MQMPGFDWDKTSLLCYSHSLGNLKFTLKRLVGRGWRCPIRFLGFVYIEKCSYKHENIAPPHLGSKTFFLRGGGGRIYEIKTPPRAFLILYHPQQQLR